MSVSVSMPQLGESVTEGTVTRWLKKEGERVEVDEPLLEVSTDKVDTEIPSPASGILRSIAVDEDETVAVGAQLAVIEDSETSDSAPAQTSPPAQEDVSPPDTAAPPQDAAESAPARRPPTGREPAGQRQHRRVERAQLRPADPGLCSPAVLRPARRPGPVAALRGADLAGADRTANTGALAAVRGVHHAGTGRPAIGLWTADHAAPAGARRPAVRPE